MFPVKGTAKEEGSPAFPVRSLFHARVLETKRPIPQTQTARTETTMMT